VIPIGKPRKPRASRSEDAPGDPNRDYPARIDCPGSEVLGCRTPDIVLERITGEDGEIFYRSTTSLEPHDVLDQFLARRAKSRKG